MINWPFVTHPQVVLEIVAGRGLHMLAVVVFAVAARVIVRRGVTTAVGRVARASDGAARAARLRTLGGLVANAVGYVIFFVAMMMILAEFGVDTKAVVTAAGVLGVGIGLGAQKLVRDVIGGFFILLENQFSVGETVTLGGSAVTGVVEEMGLRVTRLRDDVGRLVMVGNADITCVTNHSRGPLSVAVDLVLPEDADIAAVRAKIASAVSGLAADAWSTLPTVQGLVEPPEGKIKVRVYGQSVPGKRDEAEMELRAALHLGVR